MNTTFILNIILLFVFQFTECQNLSLHISGEDPTQTKIIDSVGYKKTFKDLKSIEFEIKILSEQLQNLGYIELQLEPLKQNTSKTFTLHINLKQHYQDIYIYDYSSYFSQEDVKRVSAQIHSDYFIIPLSQTNSTLSQLNRILINKGAPFSTLQLQHIQKHNATHLKAILTPSLSPTRTIDNIIIKGYEKFPKSYLKHFLKIKKGNLFTIETLKTKASQLQSIPFANAIKPPEILFTTDSTDIYLYIEQTKINSFDGFLGFGTNEDSNNIEFDGYLNLILTNNLHYGESLKLNYKSDEIDQKTLNINLNLPYIFSSPLGTELELNIFKKDSTFTTTKQAANIFYQLTPIQKIFTGLTSIQSNNLLEISTTEINDYSSQFYNLRYEYIKNNLKSRVFPINFAVKTTLSTGFRKTTEDKTTQNSINVFLEKNFKLNDYNSFYIKYNSAILFSENFLNNELFRFGGINSIRGFEENSIESNAFGVLNTEYRYIISQNLYIHSIIDLSYFENQNNNLKEKLFGFGFGFGLLTQSGLLKFNYANGKTEKQNFKFSDSKIHISLTAKF
ncbi:MAG: hypothetical protein HRT67_07835 [Flavobacteriaceae bacterium]|nr:hypothetical protein [Flavobacteriaceae bacterium]